MKYIADFTIAGNESEPNGYSLLTLQSDKTLPAIFPGQFAEVLVPNAQDVFLRRPLSFHDVNPGLNQVKLLVQAVGKGTRALCNMSVGDKVNLVYPLGKGFDMPNSSRVLLVGGGCGVAPLLFLGRQLALNGIRPRFLFGSKSADTMVKLDAYRELGEVMVTTEDGSMGYKGYVIHHPVLKTQNPDFDWMYVCGPNAMMKVLSKYAHDRGITCQVSLENLMACGFGACLCCVAPTTGGFKCTCVDGPVFDSKLLTW